MSETNEPKLSPCPVCGGEAEYEIYGDENESAHVACRQCGFWFPSPNEDVDIVEIWNRLTPAVPQWTKERPKEPGYYLSYSSWNKEIVMIRVSKDEVTYRKDVEPDSRTVWLKLDVPPLPEGKETE